MKSQAGSPALFPGLSLLLLLVITSSPSLSSDVTPTADPTPPPTPPSGHPDRGDYNVTNNGTVCLMARMGLQLNITFLSRSQGKAVQKIINLQPNLITTAGSCEISNSTLILREEQINLTFSFILNITSKRFHLQELELSANVSDMAQPMFVRNTDLDYFQGTLGYSYMCHEEQIISVGQNFSLNTFQLQVQPFSVHDDVFAEAEMCEMDKHEMLIPIAVGAALAGLVLVVLFAYLIGRRRSHAGYQTI